ncbi:hypothetical protein BDM02DRAFT_3117535 [Thelephora ganbajun]|uniref:Uncharacterized protein n=1 Tax=Thelephora ganbajun TaxID=370292 RepID=A0ACB6ZC96_THEGA|nr:hypothetical protein BDM02DRAFT_3117535 [Thelephora ganbajun]
MGNIPGADWFNARTRTQAGTGRLNAAVGVFRAWEPQTTTIDSLLGGFDGMEPLVAEPPVAEQRDDAGNQRCQVEEENGKDRKWDESLRHTRPSTNTASGRIASDSDDSTSISQSAGPIRNDRGEGISVGLDCEVEDCNLVPGHGNRDGKRVDLKPSPRRGDWRCGVDEFKLRRINEGGERERFDGFVLSAPTDPYTDFAFDLDRTAHDDPQRTSGPSVAAGLDHPSVSETLRPLESAIGLHTGAETTVDLAPMDVDTTFSGPISKGISSREGEAQGCGQLSDSLPSLLPFQFSTSKLPAPASSLSLLPPAVTAAYDLALMDLDLGSSLETPAEVRPRPTPRISATVFGSGLTLGSVGPASTLISPGPAAIREKVFVGPSLFLGDDGME